MTTPKLFSQKESLIASVSEMTQQSSGVFWLVDANTRTHCLPLLSNTNNHHIIEVEPGETAKAYSSAAEVWNQLLANHADRKSLLICLGGGVVTDLGGWVASTYKRGIPFLHIPTTLLSMTDASVGGKTGINLGHVKNAVGTFADPLAIMIHPGFLTTLHPDELRSGFAEMLKHGLIASADHWHQVCSAMVHGELNDELVLESAMIKWHIAEKDPEEKAGRRLLNFGHTFGHALESVMLENRSPVTHGDAVAAGMVAEVILSRMKGLLPDPQAEVIVADLLRLFPIQELFAIDFERLWSYMVHDKKAVHGIQKITLLRGAGHALHGQACTVPEISAAWENARNLVNG